MQCFLQESTVLFDRSNFTQYDPTQEPIFPSELQLNEDYDSLSLMFKSERVTWYRPTNLSTLLELKAMHSHARLIIGNTEVGKCLTASIQRASLSYPSRGDHIKLQFPSVKILHILHGTYTAVKLLNDTR